jgi:hypothetical protein
MNKIINCCSEEHSVVVKLKDGREWTLPYSGTEARIFSEVKKSFDLMLDDGIELPIVEQQNSRVVLIPGMDEFPGPQDGIFYIVSAVVREFLPLRQDLLSPDGGSTAKREDGRILYVRRLRKNVTPEEVCKES